MYVETVFAGFQCLMEQKKKKKLTKTLWKLKDGTAMQAMRPVHVAFEHGDAGIAPGAAP